MADLTLSVFVLVVTDLTLSVFWLCFFSVCIEFCLSVVFTEGVMVCI